MTSKQTTLSIALFLGLGAAVLSGCDRRDNTAETVSTAASDAVEDDNMGLGNASEQTAGLGTARTAPGAAGAGGNEGVSDQSGIGETDMEPTAAGARQSSTPFSDAEQRFVQQAVEAGLFEVAAAKLAMEKAQDESIRRMAERLLSDHQAANQKLMQLAGGRATLPTDVSSKKREALDALGKLNGAEFDRKFLQNVGIEDHKEGVALFERSQNNVQDAELKAFIQNTLPTLKHHLSTAQDLKSTRKDKG
jgi:putative membrane protein